MATPSFDPGLTQQYTGALNRAINKDGNFNVIREGTSWRDVHPYLHLINMPAPQFFGLVLASYMLVNVIFATFYFILGPHHLLGGDAPTATGRFLNAFFFSSHTLTTVGYGNISPEGFWSNLFATLEALTGLLGFAVITGVLFGRFSRPSARIGFSSRALVAPYQGGESLQLRVVNRRSNLITELNAEVILMTVTGAPGERKRNFYALPLERNSISFFALTWTIVHPIGQSSPLYNKTAEELEELQAEILVQIKGFDETFSQTVRARNSYRYDEIAWHAKFSPAFNFDDQGHMVLHVDRVSDYAAQQTA